jgi:two-component system response regulator AtoC
MPNSVLLIDDDQRILQAIGRYLTRFGYEVLEQDTGERGVEEYRRSSPDVVLLDLNLPDISGFDVLRAIKPLGASVIMLTGSGDIQTAVQAMQLGAENYLTKPVELTHLVVALERVLDKVRLRHEIELLKSKAAPDEDLSALGVSPAMQQLRSQIELIAASERTTVLLTGESGTGKGVVAHMIHRLSPRSQAPFVDINCAGLSANLLESELFGHEKGAFTDAKERKQGLFEVADGGTVFLDEIGDLATGLQPKLLKVLEEKTFRRIGGTKELAVDVRLIASTNRDLEASVRDGRFREDLYYRLRVMPVHLAPVRERSREDRRHLLERILAHASRASGTPVELDPAVIEHLLEYRWPGNVREIRNVIERAMILAGPGGAVRLEHLPEELRGPRARGGGGYQSESLSDVERRQIALALEHHRGNRTHTARDLGISRATLIKKIKQFGLA